MSDDGLTEATQRVMRRAGCEKSRASFFVGGVETWGCREHASYWTEAGCPFAEALARAAREDVADRILQARADALEDFAEHHIRNQSPGRIVEDMAARAAAIRDGEA